MMDIYSKTLPVIGFADANATSETPTPANITSSSKGLFFSNTNATAVPVTIQFYGATAGAVLNSVVYIPGAGGKSGLGSAGTLLLPVKAKQIVTWGGIVTGGVSAFEIY